MTTELVEPATSPLPAAGDRRQLAVALCGLALVYVVIAALGDARAWSGSDAGGKVATIKYMADHHTFKPDVGYWAGDVDPTALHHPLVLTNAVGHQFVQVTTLPFVYLGLPLWHLAGARGLLLLPILGSLLAAYAARRLARALGAAKGWWAFWLVGAASPVLFYATDFWEHSAAIGLALLAMALALEDRGWVRAGAAGLAGGVAGVLRADVLVYLAVAAIVILCTAEQRRRWFVRPGSVISAAIGTGAPLLAARLAERALLSGPAGPAGVAGRSGTAVSQAATDVPQRLRDGLVTTIGLFPDESTRYLALGVVIALVLGWFAWRARERDDGSSWELQRVDRLAAALVIAAFAARLVNGLGFIPGMAMAAPLAAVGVVSVHGSKQRVVLLVATVAIPLIWLFQWKGQLIPQWGGRYLLVSGALLTVLAAVAIERAGKLTAATGLAVALAAAVSVFGVAWHVQRTRSVASAAASLDSVPSDVVIVSQIAHLGREAGAFYGNHRWLTSDVSGNLDDLEPILAAHHIARVDVVGLEGSSPAAVISGYTEVGIRHVPFLGFQLRVTRLVAG